MINNPSQNERDCFFLYNFVSVESYECHQAIY